jgi:hypothetical protein
MRATRSTSRRHLKQKPWWSSSGSVQWQTLMATCQDGESFSLSPGGLSRLCRVCSDRLALACLVGVSVLVLTSSGRLLI